MRFMLALIGALLIFESVAKKSELYRCTQQDGSVVIQDRRCMVTALHQSSKKRQQTKAVLDQKMTQPRSSSDNRTQASIKTKITSRSPYFTFGWERFIAANWLMHKQQVGGFEETWWSKSKFNSPANFKEGVTLRAYKNTTLSTGQGAFAQALALYHRIRDNNTFKLLDSQFKSHHKFKVFNIKYQQPSGLLTTTEYYIDEHNNDLFVLTVQAHELNWSDQWQLATKIIQNL